MSKNAEINDGYWLRSQASRNGIPADCIGVYRRLFNAAIGHSKGLIDAIISASGGAVRLPMHKECIEQYLTGYMFEYQRFSGRLVDDECVEGFWLTDGDDPSCIIIYYKCDSSPQRQRYSQVHELMHFVQSVDPPFLDFFDELILGSSLPESVVAKLLHRITERTTAMFLMPNDYFVKKYREVRERSPMFGDAQLRQLAQVFDVSPQSVRYRIDECLREQPMLRQTGFMTT